MNIDGDPGAMLDNLLTDLDRQPLPLPLPLPFPPPAPGDLPVATLRDEIQRVAPRLGTGSYDDPSLDWRGSCWARQAVTDLDHAVLITVESDIHAGLLYAMGTVASAGRSRSPREFVCLVDLVEAYLIDLQAPDTESHCSTSGESE